MIGSTFLCQRDQVVGGVQAAAVGLAKALATRANSEYSERMLGGLVRGQRVSIPNSVSPEFFENWEKRDEYREVLFAGSLASLKNIAGILRAFAIVKARLDDVRLTLAGSAVNPTYAARLRKLVVQLVPHQHDFDR